MASVAHWRTALMAGVAALLVAATIYDYTWGGSSRRMSELPYDAPVLARTSPTLVTPSRTAELIEEGERLRHFIHYAPQLRARYNDISGAYAETVATFATLYQIGESPMVAVRQRIMQRILREVSIHDLLIAETPANEKGAVIVTARLRLESGDSEAFLNTILALGDAASGMKWKELYLEGSPDKRRLSASGQIALLMIEQAE